MGKSGLPGLTQINPLRRERRTAPIAKAGSERDQFLCPTCMAALTQINGAGP
jgi:hypothetical protein